MILKSGPKWWVVSGWLHGCFVSGNLPETFSSFDFTGSGMLCLEETPLDCERHQRSPAFRLVMRRAERMGMSLKFLSFLFFSSCCLLLLQHWRRF